MRHLPLACLSLALLAAPLGQNPEPHEALARHNLGLAQEAMTRGESEAAAALLRRALSESNGISYKKARKSLQSRISRLLRKTDPTQKSRARAETGGAKALLRLANSYAKKKWYRTATGLLETARRLDASVAEDRLRELERILDRTSFGSAESVFPIFEGGREPYRLKGWRNNGAWFESPAPDAAKNATAILSKRSFPVTLELSIEIRFDEGHGTAGVMFGFTEQEKLDLFHLVQIRNYKSFTELQVIYSDGKEYHTLHQSYPPVPESIRKGWMRMKLDYDHQKVRVRIADAEAIEVELRSKSQAGLLGLYVEGNTTSKGPTGFRHLMTRQPEK
ncbi:MAG: hypothetical protein ACE5F1_02830 [Planctomycetota bacterium]